MIKREQPYHAERAVPSEQWIFEQMFRRGLVPARRPVPGGGRPDDEGPSGSRRKELPGRFSLN
jgi:hypothetical protein